LHWFLVGSFLVSEHHGISQRIAREIPRHRRAQAFLSLLLPGPARGLTFLLANLFCLVAVTGVGEMAAIWSGATVAAAGKQYVTLVVMALASYVAFYCGLGRLFVAALRRRRSIPTPTGAALVWLLAAIGSAVPNFFAMISPLHQFQVYYLWQLTDPIATVREIYDSPPWTSLAFIPIGMSLLAILFNLRGMANGVMEVIAAGLQAPFRRRKSATDPALATDRPSDGVAGSAELSMRSASEG
jgi:hypothetical protein